MTASDRSGPFAALLIAGTGILAVAAAVDGFPADAVGAAVGVGLVLAAGSLRFRT